MNLRQTYEQVIANKLKQLPAPDADVAWQQMKRLLDDDEDRGAGGRKHPPGNGRGWWRMGALAIVLSASFWLYEKNKVPEKALSKSNAAVSPQAGNKTSEANNTNSSTNNQTATIDNTTTLPGPNSTNEPVNNAAASNTMAGNTPIAATVTKSNTGTPAVNTGASTNAGNNSAGTVINKTHTSGKVSEGSNDQGLGINNMPLKTSTNAPPINKAGKNNGKLSNDHAASITNSLVTGNNKEQGRTKSKKVNYNELLGHNLTSLATAENTSNNPQHTVTGQINKTEKGIAKETNTGVGHENDEGYTTTKKTGNIKQRPSGKTNSLRVGGDDKHFTTIDDNDPYSNTAGGFNSRLNEPVAAREKTWFAQLAELKTTDPAPAFNTSLITGDNMEDSLDVTNLLSNETKKLVVKAKRDKEIEDLTRKEKKSFHLNLSNVFKPFSLQLDAEPRWAAGIGLNNGITLNAQNRFNYNMNGKSGTLTDYIPSLYLQFHLNEYVYMQTELNFISPQYTPQLLLYQHSSDISMQAAGMSQQKSIYVKKLYYFNLPVSLHYSPISNVYFSAGLQFSSFQSGLAAIEQKQYETTLGPDHASNSSTNILKFKDDSIAAQIAPNEWRWQVGADYYWNRFSAGLRYNQAFKNAINTVVQPASPATTFRNESLIFFVRYNLFESRKKGSGEQKN